MLLNGIDASCHSPSLPSNKPLLADQPGNQQIITTPLPSSLKSLTFPDRQLGCHKHPLQRQPGRKFRNINAAQPGIPDPIPRPDNSTAHNNSVNLLHLLFNVLEAKTESNLFQGRTLDVDRSAGASTKPFWWTISAPLKTFGLAWYRCSKHRVGRRPPTLYKHSLLCADTLDTPILEQKLKLLKKN